MKFWLLQSLIAFDQFLNAALFCGWADETMSSNAWRMEQQGRMWGKFARPFIDLLASPWQKDHCRSAFFEERLHRQLPPEER